LDFSVAIAASFNQPFGELDKIFAYPSMTVAAIDREVHHATIIEIEADSYRKRQAISHNCKSRLELALTPKKCKKEEQETKRWK